MSHHRSNDLDCEGASQLLARATAQAVEEQHGGVRVLRVFFDHGHEWPLWEVGDKTAMEPSDYGFSPGLTELLRRWHDAWEPIADFDIDQIDEPPAPGARAGLDELARRGIEGIRAEVGSDVTVDATRAIS